MPNGINLKKILTTLCYCDIYNANSISCYTAKIILKQGERGGVKTKARDYRKISDITIDEDNLGEKNNLVEIKK